MKRSVRHSVMLLVLLASNGRAQVTDWEFQGIKVGRPRAAKPLDCGTDDVLKERVRNCVKNVRLGTLSAMTITSVVMTTKNEGLVARWTALFNQGTPWSDVVLAFQAMYGAPTKIDTSTVQNRMGAQFLNERLTWKFPSGDLFVERMPISVDQPAATIVHDSLNTVIRIATDSVKADAARKAMKKGGT